MSSIDEYVQLAIEAKKDGRPRLRLTTTTQRQLALEDELASKISKLAETWHLGNYGNVRRANSKRIENLIQGYVEEAYLLGKKYIDKNHDTKMPLTHKDLIAIKKISDNAVFRFWALVSKIEPKTESVTFQGFLSNLSSSISRFIAQAVNTGSLNAVAANAINLINASIQDPGISKGYTGMLPGMTSGYNDVISLPQLEMEFVTMHDDRVCFICEPYDGQRFQIDIHTGIIINGPLLPDDTHPNCRCRYMEVIDGEVQLG